MAIAFVYGADSAASGSSTTITRAATYTAGDTILVWVHYSSNTITATVADGTNTFTQVGTYVTDTGGHNNRCALFEAHNVAGGSVTITVTFSLTTTNRAVAYIRCTGANTGAGAQDGKGQFQHNPGTGTDAVSTTNMTPTSQPNGVLAVSITTISATTLTAGTGYTSLGTIASWDALAGDTSRVEWKRTTSTSAVAGTFTDSGATEDTHTIGGVFTEASAGATFVWGGQVVQAANDVRRPNMVCY